MSHLVGPGTVGWLERRRRELPIGLHQLLDEGNRQGFLGPTPLADQIDHALGFAWTVESVLGREPASLLDLGSGGGLPGLVLATLWRRSRCALVESNRRRAQHLVRALDQLDLLDRADVLSDRAELLGRDQRRRQSCEAVTARSFGPPSVTAECGAPFVSVGGCLVVSEPPDAALNDGRWPLPPLAQLGLTSPRLVKFNGRFGYRVLTKREPTDLRFPRRVGVPAKRPLF